MGRRLVPGDLLRGELRRTMVWTTSGSPSLLSAHPGQARPRQDRGSPSVELVLTQSSSPVSPEDLQHRPTSHLQYLCQHGHNIKFSSSRSSTASVNHILLHCPRHDYTTTAGESSIPSSSISHTNTPCQIKIPSQVARPPEPELSNEAHVGGILLLVSKSKHLEKNYVCDFKKVLLGQQKFWGLRNVTFRFCIRYPFVNFGCTVCRFTAF